MRFVVPTLLCLLLAGCSYDPTWESGTSEPVGTPSAVAASPTCDLVPQEALAELLAEGAGPPTPDSTVWMSTCRWAGEAGAYVEVTSATALEWLRELPLELRKFEGEGEHAGSPLLRQLRRAADRVNSGGDTASLRGCRLYAVWAELVGHPAGTQEIVTGGPDSDEPLGIVGQACTRGRFTMVRVHDPAGLDAEVAYAVIEGALEEAHRRSLEHAAAAEQG